MYFTYSQLAASNLCGDEKSGAHGRVICQRHSGHVGEHHYSEGRSITVYTFCECSGCVAEKADDGV